MRISLSSHVEPEPTGAAPFLAGVRSLGKEGSASGLLFKI